MRTLHNYLVREILSTLLMTVAVFTFVLLLGNVLKEILAMLVNRQASLLMVVQAVGLLIPFVLVFALPMGMLTATLLFFGRFSADNELTAVRASGISLVALITPALLLSLALSGVCALVNLQLAPQCRMAYKRLLASVALARAESFLQEKTYIKEISGHIVYIDRIDGTNLHDVLVYRLDKQDKVEAYSRAAEGDFSVDRTNSVVTVRFRETWAIDLKEGERTRPMFSGAQELPPYTNRVLRGEEKLTLNNMTFLQLCDELRELEKRLATPAAMEKLPNEQLRQKMRDLVEQQRADLTLPVRVQMHRQVSFSFACLGFTLVGIPLGIRAHRRETTFGIAVALVLVVFYYSFFILGQSLGTRPEWAPHLILWLPNFLFQAVGGVLLWRANRGV